MARRVVGGAREGVGEGVGVGVEVGVRVALALAPGAYCPRITMSSTRKVDVLQPMLTSAQQKSGLPSAAGGKVTAGMAAREPEMVVLGPRRVKLAPLSVL